MKSGGELTTKAKLKTKIDKYQEELGKLGKEEKLNAESPVRKFKKLLKRSQRRLARLEKIKARHNSKEK